MRYLILCLVLGAAIPIYLLYPRGEEGRAYVLGPSFPDRRHLQYLAVEGGTGIECIYLVRSFEYDPRRDLSGQAAVLAKIQRSGQRVSLPADQLFDIVVVVRAKAPEGIPFVDKRYFRVVLQGASSTDDMEYVFENSGYGTSHGYLRANVVFDNDGDRYLLSPGQELRLEELELQVWA